MKKHVKILLLFATILIITTDLFGMSVDFGRRYIAIDSLFQDDTLRFVELDLRERAIVFNIENQNLTFEQKSEPTTHNQPFGQHLIHKHETGYVVLRVVELLYVGTDSVYISASYERLNCRSRRLGKSIKIDRLAVCKTALLGVVVSRPVEEIKRSSRNLGWFIGGFAVIVAILAILAGT